MRIKLRPFRERKVYIRTSVDRRSFGSRHVNIKMQFHPAAHPGSSPIA